MMRTIAMAGLLVAVLAAPALAHKLKVFAVVEGDALAGTAYFAGGGKAAEVAGRIAGPDGTVVAEFRTDADGRFRVPVDAARAHTVTIDSGDGHVASLTVAGTGAATPAAATPSSSPQPTADEVSRRIDEAVARQLRPLREQLDAHDSRVRAMDVLGGIGFIFGLFGTGAWIASRRGRKS